MTAANWISLADAAARLDTSGDAETLRRLCYDGRVRSRAMVGRAVVELGPEWWTGAVEIDTASGRIVKGPLSRRLPTRTQSDPGDPLGLGDWQDAPIQGNLAETVEIARADLDAALSGASPNDTRPDTEPPPHATVDPAPKSAPESATEQAPNRTMETGGPPAAPSASSSPPIALSSPAGYSPVRLESWYAAWVAANEETGHAPSRAEDLAAAKEALGDAVPREAVRALRRQLAPAGWRKQGRRTER